MHFLTSVTSFIAISTTAGFVPSSLLSAPVRLSPLCESATDITGTVKWYNPERGFGFIAVDDGSADMYVHATGLATDGPLIEDDRVSFVTEIDRRTNKPKAVNVVRRADEQGTLPASVEESTVVEAIAEQPNEAKTSEKTAEAEAFQRARLKFQLEQKAKDDAAAKVAEEKAAKEAEETRLAGEAAVAAVAKAAAEEAAAKEAEEKRIAEEAAAAKAAAEEAAAKEAEEKRLAEIEAARVAEKEAEEAKAKELGYPSVEIMKARQQPKSPEEEAALASKYGAMELGERAFAILVDLGMIDLHPDPDDTSRDTSKDDEDVECI